MRQSIALLVAAGILLVSVSGAQEQRRRGSRPQPPEQKADADKKADDKKADEKKAEDKKAAAPVTAIVGGDIYTVTREVIRGGTILIRDGKIEKVGQDITVPEGATVIDASGRTVTPGFVSITTSGVAVGGGGGRRGPPIGGSSSSGGALKDSLDPFDQNIKIALGVGITTGCIQQRASGRRRSRRSTNDRFLGLDPEPEDIENEVEWNIDFGDPNTSVCPCCGLPILPTEPIGPAPPQTSTPQKDAVVKLSYGVLENMLVTDSVFYHLQSGGLAGRLDRHNFRDQVAKARKYLKDQAAHEKATKEGKKVSPPRRPVSEELLKLVKKEIKLRIRVNTVDEIRDMLALAKELDFEVVLDGVLEGWVIPQDLAQSGAAVVITPRERRDAQFAKEDTTGSSIELSRTLEEAGVPFAVSTLPDFRTRTRGGISLNGLAGRDLTSLPLEAAFAVRGGCEQSTALAALTIEPARMLGLDERIGSIEEGKDADILILNGHPLDYRTYVETAMVNGRVAYERSEDRIFPVFER